MIPKILTTAEFAEAANEYYFLLNRDYPERGALKLVGDRYRLSGTQRNCLYRGITSRTSADNRKKKQTENPDNQFIHIDGYNVLFTIMNYLLGKILFIANDGFLRDSGEAYGKIESQNLLSRAAGLALDYMSHSPPEYSLIHLDNSVDNSREHRNILVNGLKARKLPGEIRHSGHADATLLKVKDGIIATSDSEIIDGSRVKVRDLARQCLEEKFERCFAELDQMLRKPD